MNAKEARSKAEKQLNSAVAAMDISGPATVETLAMYAKRAEARTAIAHGFLRLAEQLDSNPQDR